MRLVVLAAVWLMAGISVVASAQEKRVALIVGNDAYKSLPMLNNAVADATAMDGKLRELGFETILRTNVGHVAMSRAVAEFGRRIGTPDTVGLVFYSGHGIQAFDRNWLVPVDADLESDDDLPAMAVDAQRILAAMDEARNPLNIVILDACRDNPLPRKGRSATRGLAVLSVAPRGSVVAFSASPNQRADDGKPGGNSVYTAELLKALDQPGLTVEQVLKRTNGGVQSATGGRQVPWFNASIQGDFYFRPQSNVSPSGPTQDAVAVELAYWNSVKDGQNVSEYEAYLQEYPKGRFAQLAKARIATFSAKPSPSSGVAPIVPIVGSHELSPNKIFRDCPDCPEMVVIPAGTFMMGLPDSEASREKIRTGQANLEKPRHRVSLSAFAAGKYEVTRAEYEAFAQSTGTPIRDVCFTWTGQKIEKDPARHWRNPGYRQEERHPVACTTWEDAKAYATWLGAKTGKTYRLFTEAEWEYAARAGTTTARHWGDDIGAGLANCKGCGSAWDAQGTAPVGSFRANAFGLHDMIGNLWEWTEDCWNEIYVGAPDNGQAWLSGTCDARVIRGGSWGSVPRVARASSRGRGGLAESFDYVGFRVARSLQ